MAHMKHVYSRRFADFGWHYHAHIGKLGYHTRWHQESRQLPGIAAGLLMGCGLMAMGHSARRLAWLNYGSFMVLCSEGALILDVLDSFTESGIVLIEAGCIMLGLVFVLERQRRALTRKIKHMIPLK